MEGILNGRTALVAGGTGSVGRVVVESLLEAGATVAVPSRSPKKLERLSAEVEPMHGERFIGLEGDIADERDGPRLLDEIDSRAGPLDAAIASLGQFVAAPSVLAASTDDLHRVLDGYLVGHFNVARSVIPALRETGGSYTFIQGPLAFRPMFPGTGLVSIVTAAQAMLARVAMEETEGGPVRVNEVVLYTRFGWDGDDTEQGALAQRDVGRYLALLASSRGEGVRGRTVHLDSLEPLRELESDAA